RGTRAAKTRDIAAVVHVAAARGHADEVSLGNSQILHATALSPPEHVNRAVLVCDVADDFASIGDGGGDRANDALKGGDFRWIAVLVPDHAVGALWGHGPRQHDVRTQAGHADHVTVIVVLEGE